MVDLIIFNNFSLRFNLKNLFGISGRFLFYLLPFFTIKEFSYAYIKIARAS